MVMASMGRFSTVLPIVCEEEKCGTESGAQKRHLVVDSSSIVYLLGNKRGIATGKAIEELGELV